MEEAIQAVERVKEKKQEEVEKLEQAIELLQGVKAEPKNPIEEQPEPFDKVVKNTSGPFNADLEREENADLEREENADLEREENADLEREENADLEREENADEQFDEVLENAPGPKSPALGPVDEVEALPKTGEANPKEDPGFIANTLSGIRDAFTPKVENVKGGKRKNRKSRKGLRTKRFSGGYRRKTRRGRRNSRRLRK